MNTREICWIKFFILLMNFINSFDQDCLGRMDFGFHPIQTMRKFSLFLSDCFFFAISVLILYFYEQKARDIKYLATMQFRI